MSIPIQNIINVSITGTPAGLPAANVNSVAIFTTETPSNVDEFNTYVTASAVQTDYGCHAVSRGASSLASRAEAHAAAYALDKSGRRYD